MSSSSGRGRGALGRKRGALGRKRGAFALLVRVAVFALVFAGLAEMWFRVVMPAASMPRSYQQDPATVVRFDPAAPNSGRFTEGRLCRTGTVWSINSDGWNSAIRYECAAARGTPLVALLGDSYVEGFATDPSEHLEVYLARAMPGTSAYAFGASGWYLEQEVAVSRYVRDRFQPDVLVFFVDEGDVTDSLRCNGAISPFRWQLAEAGRSFKEIPPSEAAVFSLKGRLARMSALLNYLVYNAHLTLPGMDRPGAAQTSAVGGAPEGAGDAGAAADAETAGAAADAEAAAAAETRRWHGLLPAARFMVDTLCAEHPGTPIVFVLFGGDRYLPADQVEQTPLLGDTRAVMEAAAGNPQCSVLDTRSVFARDWEACRCRFECSDGVHWNAYANKLVAGEIADLIARRGLLAD